MKGTEFVQLAWDMPPGRERNTLIFDSILKSFRTMPMERIPIGTRGYFECTHDYLSVGTEDDFIRIPVDAPTAQKCADHLGFLLPTQKMVDMIWHQATIKLDPVPMTPLAPQMMGVPYFATHNSYIEDKRQGQSGLIAGIKKDIVVSNRLMDKPKSVPIYGWHRKNGKPIQDLSLVHEATYADYSHGVRLISPVVHLDGLDLPFEQVLSDPTFASLFIEGVDLQLALSLRWTRLPGVVWGDDTIPSPPPSAPPPTAPTPASGIPLTQPTKSPPKSDEPGIVFVQAERFKSIPAGRKIDLVCLHTAELPEKPNGAESVAAYFKRPRDGKGNIVDASAHYCVDSDSTVQCVLEKDIAWAAPGANNNGIHIELTGWAKQTAADWEDAYSTAELQIAASLVAKICARNGIPAQFVDEHELADEKGVARGARGITTHACVSKAFKKSTHTDPGTGFPMVRFIDMVRAAFESPYD